VTSQRKAPACIPRSRINMISRSVILDNGVVCGARLSFPVSRHN
jgi:hypothetical protein